MNDLVPITRRTGDKALVLILGLAGRIGLGFVLITGLFRSLAVPRPVFLVGHAAISGREVVGTGSSYTKELIMEIRLFTGFCGNQ